MFDESCVEMFHNKSFTGLAYVTPNHKNHDDYWLYPGISSAYFCFACTVENLEDQSVLFIRKKNIMTEMLEVFLNNDNFWKVLCSQHAVLVHSLELFTQLILQSEDSEFKGLAVELSVLICQRTSPSHTVGIIVDKILSMSKYFVNVSLIQLLGNLCEVSHQTINLLHNNNKCFIEDYMLQFNNKLGETTILPYWFLLTHVFKSEVQLPSSSLKMYIITIVEVLKASSNIEVVRLVLESLYYFSKTKDNRTVLLEHEYSKFTQNPQSVIEVLKKTLLSKEPSIQLATIKCIQTLSNDDSGESNQNTVYSSIVKLILEKGLNEYLFELLISSNELVMIELFNCLIILIQSKLFLKGGHMIFGLSPTLQAIKKSQHFKNIEISCKGVEFLKILLEKGGDVFSISADKSFEMIEILASYFTRCERLKVLVVDTLLALIKTVKSFTLKFYTKCIDLLLVICDHMEREVTVISFSTKIYHCTYNVIVALANLQHSKIDSSQKMSSSFESKSADTAKLDADVIVGKAESLMIDYESLYYISDKYLIAQATVKFLPLKNIEFQSIFYQFLLAIIELVPEKGSLIAKKLAESSVFYQIYEFKVICHQMTIKLNEVLSKVILHLCLSLDNEYLAKAVEQSLYNALVNFNIPLDDWKFLLTSQGTSSQQEFIVESRLSALALLTYSHKGGRCILPFTSLMIYLQKFASCKPSVSTLPTNGKRYLLYLWAHLEESVKVNIDIESRHNIVQMLNIGSVKDLFMRSDSLIAWMLKVNLDESIKVMLCKLYLKRSSDKEQEDWGELNLKKFENLLTTIISNGHLQIFIEIVLNCFIECEKKSVFSDLIFLFDLSIAHLSEKALIELTNHINRMFLIATAIQSQNIMYIFKCLNLIHVAKSTILADDDIKLFYRAVNFIPENTTPNLLLEIVNYLYLTFFKSNISHNLKPLGCVVQSEALFETFKKSVFQNDHLIRNASTSTICEQLYSSIILTFTQIIRNVQLFGLPRTTVEATIEELLSCKKSLLIEALHQINLPILLNAAILFWKEIFEYRLKPRALKFTHQNEVCSIEKEDINRIVICLQNHCYHDEVLIKNNAVSCLNVILQNHIIRSSWQRKLESLAIEHLSSEGYNVFQVKVISLCIPKSKYNRKILDLLLKFTETYIESEEFENENVYIKFVETVILTWLQSIEYSTLKTLKSALYQVETRLAKSSKTIESDSSFLNVVYLSGVLFVKCDNDVTGNLYDVIKNVRRKLEERINILEDGETDSEGGT